MKYQKSSMRAIYNAFITLMDREKYINNNSDLPSNHEIINQFRSRSKISLINCITKKNDYGLCFFINEHIEKEFLKFYRSNYC